MSTGYILIRMFSKIAKNPEVLRKFYFKEKPKSVEIEKFTVEVKELVPSLNNSVNIKTNSGLRITKAEHKYLASERSCEPVYTSMISMNTSNLNNTSMSGISRNNTASFGFDNKASSICISPAM